MIYGTSHFPSLYAAKRYFRNQGTDITAVRQKIASGEITIGHPITQPGQCAILIDSGQRYGIVEQPGRPAPAFPDVKRQG